MFSRGAAQAKWSPHEPRTTAEYYYTQQVLVASGSRSWVCASCFPLHECEDIRLFFSVRSLGHQGLW